MITVYHNENFLDVRGWNWGKKAMPQAEALTAVAQVYTNDLDEAFRLTNTIDQPWWLNDGLIPLKDKTRSTSCGDVLVVHDGPHDSNPKAHVVADVGFVEVPGLARELARLEAHKAIRASAR